MGEWILVMLSSYERNVVQSNGLPWREGSFRVHIPRELVESQHYTKMLRDGLRFRVEFAPRRGPRFHLMGNVLRVNFFPEGTMVYLKPVSGESSRLYTFNLALLWIPSKGACGIL